MTTVNMTFNLSELQDLQYALQNSYDRIYSDWMADKISTEQFKPIHDRLTTLQDRFDNALYFALEYQDAVDAPVRPVRPV